MFEFVVLDVNQLQKKQLKYFHEIVQAHQSHLLQSICNFVSFI